jgi:dipeptidyl aminopeptidase/acylaminoacyl peptidase
VSAATVATGLRGTLWQVRLSGEDVYWLEVLPHEGGRTVIVRRRASGAIETVTPPGFDVRTRVHEYGGGDYLLAGERIVFARKDDQRLYLQAPGRSPEPITPPSSPPGAVRFADGDLHPGGRWMAWVRETHRDDGTTVNDLVRVSLDGSEPMALLAADHDFYAAPRFSPDGSHLAFLTWDHPQMPWDGTQLWLAPVARDGTPGDPRLLAGGTDESILEPRWSPQGVLHYLSDRTGWWNLYADSGEGARQLIGVQAELGVPAWVLGLARYTFLDDGSIVCIVSESGLDHLARLGPGDHALRPIEGPWTCFYPSSIVSRGTTVWTIAGAPGLAQSIVQTDVHHAAHRIVHASFEVPFDDAWVSHPMPLRVAVGGDEWAHALYYAPTHPALQGPRGDFPPLIVLSHGGPTAFAMTFLLPHIQFWTSRGIAVVDVNYRGSAGYGRAYRRALCGRWGLADVEDCLAAARRLAGDGLADPRRMAIRGGSAGGFTTLCALTFHRLFAAGVSYYGVGDLESLAKDTHKFEAHYLDGLVGPYPEERETYRRRSPIHAVDRITCPVILFQGLDDHVVPPEQSEAIASALEARRLPHAYLTFPGEGHGFRAAETVIRCQQAELTFLSRVFGFSTDAPAEPLAIRHLTSP